MPKQAKVRNRFDGGTNTKSSAKDINENDLVSANNVFINEFGTVKSGGKAVVNSGDGDEDYTVLSSTSIIAGYGLYQSSVDFKKDNTNVTTVKTFLAVPNGNSNANAGLTTIKESEDGGAWADALSTATATNNGHSKTIFHKADGVIRIADANIPDTNAKVKWFGHIKRTLFKPLIPSDFATSSLQSINEYVSEDNDLGKPGVYPIGIHATTKAYPETGVNSVGIKINDSDGGDWEAGTYQTAQSFVYDGNQESLLKVGTTYTLSASNRKFEIIIGYQPNTSFSKRITHSRIYVRENGTDDDWILFAEVSFVDGIRTQLDSDYSAWEDTEANSNQVYTKEVLSLKPNVDTYETINGYNADEPAVSIGGAGEGYKTSVVTNGRTFLANIKTTNKDNEIVHMPDRIMYSQMGKYDTFPTSNYLDIGINDGDEFIKLESFADRLFAYKKNKLYIINIGNGADTQWFLENEYTALGVTSYNATVKVDLGIMWANENGLYLYDGQAVTNLQNKIDDQVWFDFCKGETLMIGFLPKKKEIIIMKGSVTGKTDAYIHHLDSKSFVYVHNLFPTGFTYSNFILDNFGKLTAYGNSDSGTDETHSYDGTQKDNRDSELLFNFEDFGNTTKIKKLYKVLVNYKSSQIHVEPFLYNYINKAGVHTTGTMTGNTAVSATQTVDTFLFNSEGTPIEAQAFQLQFKPYNVYSGNNSNKSNWSIDDITIVYRVAGKTVT